MDMALGCSTNSMLHLPAIAHEAGVELNMEIANELSSRTPNLCHLAPAGPTYIDVYKRQFLICALLEMLRKTAAGLPGRLRRNKEGGRKQGWLERKALKLDERLLRENEM